MGSPLFGCALVRLGGLMVGAAQVDDAASFQAATGGFEVRYEAGGSWSSIGRTPWDGTSALHWIPGGGSAALGVLDRRHLRSAREEATRFPGRRFTLRGELDWAAYALGIELPALGRLVTSAAGRAARPAHAGTGSPVPGRLCGATLKQGNRGSILAGRR